MPDRGVSMSVNVGTGSGTEAPAGPGGPAATMPEEHHQHGGRQPTRTQPIARSTSRSAGHRHHRYESPRNRVWPAPDRRRVRPSVGRLAWTHGRMGP